MFAISDAGPLILFCFSQRTFSFLTTIISIAHVLQSRSHSSYEKLFSQRNVHPMQVLSTERCAHCDL